MGHSTLVAESIAALHTRSPEALREMLLSDKWLALALDCFEARLRDKTRDGLRHYLEAVKLVNGRDSAAALALVLSGMGVRDEDEARDLIARAKGVASATPDDAYRLAKDIVRSRLKADPRERRRLMQELFGEIEAPQIAQESGLSVGMGSVSKEGTRAPARAALARHSANGNGSGNNESED